MDDSVNTQDLDAPCPKCAAPGVNRIWQCGSLMLSGEHQQGVACKYAEDLRAERDRYHKALTEIHEYEGAGYALFTYNTATEALKDD